MDKFGKTCSNCVHLCPVSISDCDSKFSELPNTSSYAYNTQGKICGLFVCFQNMHILSDAGHNGCADDVFGEFVRHLLPCCDVCFERGSGHRDVVRGLYCQSGMLHPSQIGYHCILLSIKWSMGLTIIYPKWSKIWNSFELPIFQRLLKYLFFLAQTITCCSMFKMTFEAVKWNHLMIIQKNLCRCFSSGIWWFGEMWSFLRYSLSLPRA